MGAIIVVLAVVGFLVLFAYLQIPPPYADKKLVGVFNAMVLVVTFVLCLMWFLKIRVTLKDTADDQWWLPVGIGGALLIEIVFLGICFLLRNFWVFKPPRHPGGSGFGR